MEDIRIQNATVGEVIKALNKYPLTAKIVSGYYPPGDDVSNDILIECYKTDNGPEVEISGDPD